MKLYELPLIELNRTLFYLQITVEYFQINAIGN